MPHIDRKLQTAALLLASSIAWVGLYEVAALPRSTEREKLEVHCIEEYGKYCGGKLSGFRFSDGCRVCKCEKTSVLCKKGPCRFFARIDEDALDYCDGVLLRNAVAYKEFTRKAKAKKQKQQMEKGPKIDTSSLKFDIKYETKPRSKKEEQAINHEMIGVLQNHVEGALKQSMNAAAKKHSNEKRPNVAVAPSGPTGEADLVDTNDFRKMFGRLSRLPHHRSKSAGAATAQLPKLGSGGMGADVIRPPVSAESSSPLDTRVAVGLQKRVPVQHLEPQLTAAGLGRESIHPLDAVLPRQTLQQAPTHVQTAPKTVKSASGDKEAVKRHAVSSVPHIVLEKDLLPPPAPQLPSQLGGKGLAPRAVVPLPTNVVNRNPKPLQAPAFVPPPPPPPPPPPQRPPVIERPKLQQPVLGLKPQVPSMTGLPAPGKRGPDNLNLAAAPIPPTPPAAGHPVMPLPAAVVEPKVAPRTGRVEPAKENLDLASLIDKLSIKNNPPKQEVHKKPNGGRLPASMPQLPHAPAPPAPAPLLGAKLPSQLKPDTVLEEYFLPQPVFEDWPPLQQPALSSRFLGNHESPMLEEDVVRQSVAHVQPTNLDRPQWQPFNEYVQEPKAVPAFHALPDSVPCDGPRRGPIPESELSVAYENSLPVGFRPTEWHEETWPEWQALHPSQHRQHSHFHRPAAQAVEILGEIDPFAGSSSHQKQGGHLRGDSTGKMSEKVKNLLALTKAAVELLVRANYTEAKLLQNATLETGHLNETADISAMNKMGGNGSDVRHTMEASQRRSALRQQVKQLTAIINKLQEIVPQVEEYAREEEKEDAEEEEEEEEQKKTNKDSMGEVNKLISATSIQAETSPTGVILMSPLGAVTGTDREQSDRERLLVKLEHCEAYSAKLLKALEEKKMLDSLDGVSNSASSKEHLISLLSALKPLL
uniref:Uncharacterized protein n=1 Tax=Schistocephalus solidus TaxID=70667 RepID=A0A0X3Q0X2_SCHSO